MDRGVSDSGDPWAVFYDLATQDSFLHVARIEQSCVLICDPLGIRLTASNVADLIATFEGEVRRILNLRTQGSATIILHPASRVIMSIAAVFLLFKFENAGAFHPKAGPDLGNGGDFATRKIDAGVLARVQSVFARLYDSIEAPTAVATLAGVILSVELAGITSRQHHPDATAEEDHHLARPVEPSHEAVREVDLAMLKQPLEPEHVLPVAPQGEQSEAVVLIEVAIDTKAAPTVVAGAEPDRTADPVVGAPVAPHGDDAAVLVAAAVPKAIPSLLIGTEQQVDLGASGEQTQAYLAVHSLAKTISTDGGHDFLSKAVPASLPDPHAAAADGGAGDAQPENSLGVVYTTQMTGFALLETLSEFISTLGEYDVQLHGDSVFIEQDDVAGLSSKEIGIWTNLMPDGSDISVIGRVDIVQEVVGVLA